MAAGKKMGPYVQDYLTFRVAQDKTDSGSIRWALEAIAKAWDNPEAPMTFRPIASMDVVWLEDWFAVNTKGRQPTTRRVYKSAMKGFIEHWRPRGIPFVFGLEKFNPGKTSTHSVRPKVWLPREFFRTTWEAQTSPYFRGLFAFTCLSMARGVEVKGLTIGDLLSPTRVNLDRPKIDDMGDKLPILPALQPEIERYMFWYRGVAKRPLKSTDYLFPRYKVHYVGKGRNEQRPIVFPETMRDNLWETCKRLMVAQLGPDFPADRLKGLGAHTLRRGMAAELYAALIEAGNQDAMRVIQGMLGHTSIVMTQLYIGMSSVREARNKAIDGFDLFGDMAKPATVLHLPTSYEDEEVAFRDGQFAFA